MYLQSSILTIHKITKSAPLVQIFFFVTGDFKPCLFNAFKQIGPPGCNINIFN